MRWRLYFGLLSGFAALACTWLATLIFADMHRRVGSVVLYFVAVDFLLLCMGFMQDDGAQRTNAPTGEQR
jgi:hypothetical protein